MSLLNPTDFPINPATTSGTNLADILNRLALAYESNQLNGTRPPEITKGGIWSKIDGAATRLMMFDGAADVEIANITAGAINVAGTVQLAPTHNIATPYKAGDIIYDTATKSYMAASRDLAAGAYNAGDWTTLTNILGSVQPAGYLKLSGGTLTGALQLPAAAPTVDTQATNKKYVDDYSTKVHNWTKAQQGAVVAIPFAATINPDFSLANNFSLALTGNATMGNPTNLVAGQSGAITITQDGAGGHTLAFGSAWKFAGGKAPSLTTAANAVDVLVYYVESTSRITAKLIGDTK